MSVGDDLARAARRGDFAAFDAVLDRLDAAGLKDAKAWYRSARSELAQRADAGWGRDESERRSLHACRQLAAVALAPGPQRAAAWFGLRSFGAWGEAGRAVVVARMAAMGRDWCAAFLEAASRLRFTGESEAEAARLAIFGAPVLGHFALRLPQGPAYARGWAEQHRRLISSAWWDHELDRRRAAGADRRHPSPASTTLVWFDDTGQVQDRQVLLRDLTLADVLRLDPLLPEALSAATATAGALGAFMGQAGEGWRLEGAVRDLLVEGRLDRSRVLEDALDALTRQDTPGTHKALAALLMAVGIEAEDVRSRVPLLQGLMATTHASVTPVLLPPLLDCVDDESEMAELALTVFARREKKVKAELLRALSAKDGVARFGRAAVVAGLAQAAELEDESLAVRARRTLEALGAPVPARPPAAAVTGGGLWQSRPLPSTVEPFQCVDPTPAALAAAVSAAAVTASVTETARFLDVLVRWAWKDVDGLREHLVTMVAPQTGGQPLVLAMARDWATGALTASTHAREVAKAGFVHSGEQPPWTSENSTYYSLPATAAFERLLVAETLLGLGRVPRLLSTPRGEDAVVAFDDLVDAVASQRGSGCGELDLFQALLRLEPVEPARLERLAGLELPVRPRRAPGPLRSMLRLGGGGRGSRSVPDAVGLVRQWVSGGGLPGLVLDHRPDGVHVAPVVPPVPGSVFPSVPRGLVAGHDPARKTDLYPWNVTPSNTVGVVPHWPDLVAAKVQQQFDQVSRDPPRWLPWLVSTAGSAGVALHHAVAATLSHEDEAARLQAVDAALTLVAQGRFDPDVFRDVCLRLLDAGELRLARTANAWEQVVLGGGLAPLWPALAAVVDRSCTRERKPVGLADLLSSARRWAASVPAASEPGALPGGVSALADARGSSKASLEARAWVAALRARVEA